VTAVFSGAHSSSSCFTREEEEEEATTEQRMAFSLDVDEQPTSAATTEVTALCVVSSDGARFAAVGQEKVAALKLANLFRTTLEGDKDATEILAPFAAGALQDVLDYLFARNGVPAPLIPSPLSSFSMKELCHGHLADAEWIDRIGEDNVRLHALINAVNAIDCPGLLNLATAKQSCILASRSHDFAAMKEAMRIRGIRGSTTTITNPDSSMHQLSPPSLMQV
jgi:hypothetical protein